MELKIFKAHELLYKLIAFSVVFLSTEACIILYINTNTTNGINTFIISIAYALTLFIVGLYVNHMKSQTQNLFYLRKTQYEDLSKLNAIFSTKLSKPASDYDSMYEFIFFHKSFTGRFKNDNHCWINQKYYYYRKDYLILEEKFLDLYKEIKKRLNDKISIYLKDCNTEDISKNIYVMDISKILRDNSEWAKEYLVLTGNELEDFNTFLNNLLHSMNKELYSIKHITKKLIRQNLIFKSKIQWAINKVQKDYGEKLEKELEKDNQYNQILSSFNDIKSLIDDINYSMLTKNFSDEIDYELSVIKESLKILYDKIDAIHDTVDMNLCGV